MWDRCVHRNNRDDARVRFLVVASFVASGVFAQNSTATPQNPQPGLQDPLLHYDPYRGMDQSGRIPKPPFPSDLQRPERWRYTPPARIKPGGLIDRFWVSSFVSPIIFREEDIGFGGGLALTDIDFRNQNFQEFANIVATYSAEGQQNFRINWSKWLNHRTL